MSARRSIIKIPLQKIKISKKPHKYIIIKKSKFGVFAAVSAHKTAMPPAFYIFRSKFGFFAICLSRKRWGYEKVFEIDVFVGSGYSINRVAGAVRFCG
jgi:hypothetical protein